MEQTIVNEIVYKSEQLGIRLRLWFRMKLVTFRGIVAGIFKNELNSGDVCYKRRQ